MSGQYSKYNGDSNKYNHFTHNVRDMQVSETASAHTITVQTLIGKSAYASNYEPSIEYRRKEGVTTQICDDFCDIFHFRK